MLASFNRGISPNPHGSMPPLEWTIAVVGFQELGGRKVSVTELEAELRRLPLDGVLGVLASISLDLLHAGAQYADPRRQGTWLNLAIVDDFPHTLPEAARMYAPGRVPITGGRHVFLHERNIAWLANEALLHCRVEEITEELHPEIQRRVCRLLLIANDLFTDPGRTLPSTLRDRRAFCLDWLRAGQFNGFFEDPLATHRSIQRQRILLLELLPRYFPDLEAVFLEASGGLGLQEYFYLMTVLTAHVHHVMAPGRHWLKKSSIARDLRRDRAEVEAILARWSATPTEYQEAVCEWHAVSKHKGRPGEDFVVLKMRPLIEARNDELISPLGTLLLAKIHDGAFFIITDHLQGTVNQNRFHVALGHAYEAYANRLVERIKNRGKWEGCESPTERGSELADFYLQRGETAISFEHKALRAPTEFLRGGSGDRVLGPPDEILERVASGSPPTLDEGRRADRGLFTRGLWQQAQHSSALVAWAKRNIGRRPARVFPVFTTLAPFRIDELVWKAYLEPLRSNAGLLMESDWEPPQWLQIEDLESLVGLSEEHGEDVEVLLTDKTTRNPGQRFDAFLYEHFGTRGWDPLLGKAAIEFLRATGLHYFDTAIHEDGE